MQQGPRPTDPELRWIADLRDHIRKATGDLLTEELIIEEKKGGVELHAYFRITEDPGKELSKVVKKTIHDYARKATNLYRLHSAVFGSDCILLTIYKKPQKKRKVR